MNETAVKVVDLSALEQARRHAENAESWGESAMALALIAIAEELRELNAQLKRNAQDHWQLP